MNVLTRRMQEKYMSIMRTQLHIKASENSIKIKLQWDVLLCHHCRLAALTSKKYKEKIREERKQFIYCNMNKGAPNACFEEY